MVGGPVRRWAAVDHLPVPPNQPEERFDRITRLAAQLFEVPMVSVVLADAEHEWLKSQQGTAVQMMPPGSSVVSGVIRTGTPVVLEDVHTDPRAARANPELVRRYRVRFLAAWPVALGGLTIGALCLAAEQPRRFDDTDREQLADVAMMVGDELDDTAESRRAAAIHQSFVPLIHPSADGYEFAGSCVPARSVGGDFLDWRRGPGGRVELTVADVMGKGIGAALLAATVRTALRGAARGSPSPAETLHRVADVVQPDLEKTAALVTVHHAWLDPGPGDYQWADAGHGLHLVVRADGSVEHPDGGGLPLGVAENAVWGTRQCWIDPGDTVVVVSDGVLGVADCLEPGSCGVVGHIAATVRAAGSGPGAAERVVAAFTSRARRGPLRDDVTAAVFHRLR